MTIKQCEKYTNINLGETIAAAGTGILIGLLAGPWLLAWLVCWSYAVELGDWTPALLVAEATLRLLTVAAATLGLTTVAALVPARGILSLEATLALRRD